MKIRLVGTESEVAQAAAVIAQILTVTEQSSPRPRRYGTDVSIYMDADLPHVARARNLAAPRRATPPQTD